VLVHIHKGTETGQFSAAVISWSIRVHNRAETRSRETLHNVTGHQYTLNFIIPFPFPFQNGVAIHHSRFFSLDATMQKYADHNSWISLQVKKYPRFACKWLCIHKQKNKNVKKNSNIRKEKVVTDSSNPLKLPHTSLCRTYYSQPFACTHVLNLIISLKTRQNNQCDDSHLRTSKSLAIRR